jgi:hypothetical protein
VAIRGRDPLQELGQSGRRGRLGSHRRGIDQDRRREPDAELLEHQSDSVPKTENTPTITTAAVVTTPAVDLIPGIEGIAATASPGVENYVNGFNTSTSGTFGPGGAALLSATSGFTNCAAQ